MSNKGKRYNKVLGHIKTEKCSFHIEHGLTMLGWYNYCEDSRKKKLEQKQCTTCGYWFWPDEYGIEPVEWNKDDPSEDGKYRVLYIHCDNPYEEKEGEDEFINGYWQGYAQFVIGWRIMQSL